MEGSPGPLEGEGEEPAGLVVTEKKKSRFKLLKSRLFGRLRRKETEGLMKQSQSASDVITQGHGEGYSDSEDDSLSGPGTLGSRALSHDSIFLADQSQSSVEPTRVLSQENVQGKIRALQLKLQQQNMRLGPPPLLIPGKRTEDSGTFSEDDGLPQSPPDVSFHDRAEQTPSYEFTDSYRHHSSLSLAGTGSEEEEQWSSQPSSRPLSPATTSPTTPARPPDQEPLPGVDLSSPAQYTPGLDNSAARHRMSLKPRNQRASGKGRKAPTRASQPRSESLSDLDLVLALALAEDEEERGPKGGEERGPVKGEEREPDKGEEGQKKRAFRAEATPASMRDDTPAPETLLRSPSPWQPEERPWSLAPPAGEDVALLKEKSSEQEEKVTNNPLFLQSLPHEIYIPCAVERSLAKSPKADRPSFTPPCQAVEELQKPPELEETKPAMTHTMPSKNKRELPAYLDRGSRPSSLKTSKQPSTVVFLDSTSSKYEPSSRGKAGETMTSGSTSKVGHSTLQAQSSPAVASVTPSPAPRAVRQTQRPVSARTAVGPPEGATASPAGQGEKPREDSIGENKDGKGFSFGSNRFAISSARHRSRNVRDGLSAGGKGDRAGGGSGEEGDGVLVKNNANQRPVREQEVRSDADRPPGVGESPLQRPEERRRPEPEDVVLGEQTRDREKKRTEKSPDMKTGMNQGQNEGEQKQETEKADGRRGAFGVKLRPTSQSVKRHSEMIKSEFRVKRHSIEVMATEPQPIRREDDAGSRVDGTSEPAWMSVAREKTRSLQQQVNSLLTPDITPDTDTPPGGAAAPPPPPHHPPPAAQARSRSTPQTSVQPPPLPGIQASSCDPAEPPPPQPCASRRTREETQRSSSSWRRPGKTSGGKPPEGTISEEAKAQTVECQAENLTTKPETPPSSSSPSSSSSPWSAVPASQPPAPPSGQPSWMELARRKSKAWNDKTKD